MDDDGPLVGAIDQGTGSSRFLVFDRECRVAKLEGRKLEHQVEVTQSTPRDEWFEQDPEELLASVRRCLEEVGGRLGEEGVQRLTGVGITNQRETTIIWDKTTGQPLHAAIVWCDGRTAQLARQLIGKKSKDQLRPRCGLPIYPYFSALKLRWMIDNSQAVRAAIDSGVCLFGTVDSWIIWNLTGGVNGGVHVTDVTNASRTMLMNIHTLQWDPDLCQFFGVPMNILPEIRTSSEVYGEIKEGLLKGVPLCGSLKLCLALWTCSQGIRGIFKAFKGYAQEVESTGDVYFVPAFSGLFAPHWRSDARGLIIGLTHSTTRAHLCRATLEAVCFQSREILDAMNQDSEPPFTQLRVDGGMTVNRTLLELQADLLGIPVVRPEVQEMTVLGAAVAAGLAKGVWPDTAHLPTLHSTPFTPSISADERDVRYGRWKEAVRRCLAWQPEDIGSQDLSHSSATLFLLGCLTGAVVGGALALALLGRR